MELGYQVEISIDFSQLRVLLEKLYEVNEKIVTPGDVMPREEILPLLEDAATRGEMAMLLSLLNEIGDKSTGDTARNLFHEATPTGFGYRVGIGANRPEGRYASRPKFAAMSTGPVMINRPVMVNKNTGKWRFIKVRPLIPAHNFLMDGGRVMTKAIQDNLLQWFEEKVNEIARTLENQESGPNQGGINE